MTLYNIEAWPKKERGPVPEWKCELDAETLEAAYRLGRQRFLAERRDLDPDQFTVEASK